MNKKTEKNTKLKQLDFSNKKKRKSFLPPAVIYIHPKNNYEQFINKFCELSESDLNTVKPNERVLIQIPTRKRKKKDDVGAHSIFRVTLTILGTLGFVHKVDNL